MAPCWIHALETRFVNLSRFHVERGGVLVTQKTGVACVTGRGMSQTSIL